MTSRNAPCKCGSGKKFKLCCGALVNREGNTHSNPAIYTNSGWFLPAFRGLGMRRFCSDPIGSHAFSRTVAPPGILIIDGFLKASLCDDWCAFMEKKSTKSLAVQDTESYAQSGQIVNIRDEGRITETVDLAEYNKDVLREVTRGYSDFVTLFFQTEIDTIEQPTALKYSPGGRYGAHSDSEYWDEHQHCWIKSLERDYSILLYLNEGYEGGTLFFPNFKFRLKPKTGMMVAFPSDHRYLHAAEPLISGTRFAVVSWAKSKTSRKVTLL